MKITRFELLAICGEYSIDFGVALENETVVNAIRQNDREALREAFESEF